MCGNAPSQKGTAARNENVLARSRQSFGDFVGGLAQSAELRGRELPKRSHLEFSDSKEFGSCIGIVSVNGQERLWILANAKYGERLKVLPASRADGGNRVRISKSEYESIKSRVELSDDVAQFLANSVEPSL